MTDRQPIRVVLADDPQTDSVFHMQQLRTVDGIALHSFFNRDTVRGVLDIGGSWHTRYTVKQPGHRALRQPGSCLRSEGR